jgi:thiol-disulfide isomerase/thioredoxin
MSPLFRFIRPGRRFVLASVLVAMALGAVLLRVLPSQAGNGNGSQGAVVVFTASWCAKCRDLAPIIQAATSEVGVPLQWVDVDNPNAPNQAQAFGVSIPGGDPPHVLWVKGGRAQSLIDSRAYNYQNAGALRQQMVNTLRGLK